MDDLRQRFATLDSVPVPEVWSEVERRLEALGGTAPTGRLVAVRPEWGGARAERSRRTSRPIRSRRHIALMVAAALIATLLVGGAFAVGSGLVRLTSVVPPSPEATPATSPVPSRAAGSPSPGISATATPLNALPARPGMFAELRDSLQASDAVGWVATSSAIYRTTDTGITWSNVRPQGVTATSVTALVDADAIYVASGGSPATIAATHDGGASWVEASLDVGAISGGPVFSFQTSLFGFATFYDANGTEPLRVYGTTDGGVTWTGPKDGQVPHMAASSDKLNPPIGGFLWQRAGKADNKPFDNRFFLSADGGATWRQYTFPIGDLAPKDALKEISAIVSEDNGRILLAINVDGGRKPIPGAIYESTEDTATWRLVQTLPMSFDVQLLSPTDWILVSTGPAEVRSTVDGGDHWRTTVSSTSFREIPRFATPDIGWVTAFCSEPRTRSLDAFCDATTQNTVIAVTTNGGATWTRIVH
jgi:hypothetical protein